MEKIIVALSGGVDSSVAAALLQEQGYAVEGVFMKNWSPEDDQSLSDCPWMEDQADAEAVCRHLGIPFRSVNFEREYREKVLDYFLSEYAAGRTPNPDVMCNKEIKFRVLLDAAKSWGATALATGHYAGIKEENGEFNLVRGVDPGKDQSYFLWMLDQVQLGFSRFPMAHMTKVDVREYAARLGLPTAAKKDSQGICFIGKMDVKKYLQEHITSKRGETFLLPRGVENGRLESAEKVGEHRGSMYYTVGERAGAIVDNRLYAHMREGDVPPLYIAEKDTERNRLYVTERRDDPVLLKRRFVLTDFRYVGFTDNPIESVKKAMAGGNIFVQIRYQQKDIPSLLSVEQEGDRVVITSAEPVWAAAPGQSAVLYEGDRVLAGGIVDKAD